MNSCYPCPPTPPSTNKSVVIYSTTAWNIPACDTLVTLVVPYLCDIMIGSYIWNPTYGYFEVTDFNSTLKTITIVNNCDTGNAAIGTYVPPYTKFIITAAPSIISQFLDFGIVTPYQYGAVGDGVANDTAAVQAALDSGAQQVYFPTGDFLCDTLTVPVDIIHLFGVGTLTQRTPNADLLEIDNSVQLTIEGLTFVGNTGAVLSASNNNAIVATTCSNFKVLNCTFTQWRYNAMYLFDVSDFEISGNYIYEISDSGIRCSGCNRGSINNNIIRDTLLGTTQFTIAMMVDTGTFSHAFGVCEDISVTGNVIVNYPNAQGIMGHAGKRITIAGNTMDSVSMPISFSPYSLVPTADDIEDLVIVGNVCNCSTVGTTVLAADGIFVGGSATEIVKNVTIAGNTITNANTTEGSLGQGGIAVGYIRTCSITGNTIENSYVNGISIFNPITGLIVANNSIFDVTASGGQANGIVVTSTSANTEGKIVDNYIDTVTTAIRLEAASPELEINRNRAVNFTTYIDNYTRAICDGRIPYTAGDTTPSVRFFASAIEIDNAGATIITNFDDGTNGQILHCKFNDANTTVARGATMKLAASADFTSANRSTLVLYNDGGIWYELSRVTNNG